MIMKLSPKASAIEKCDKNVDCDVLGAPKREIGISRPEILLSKLT
jgi:hypothetical protein